MSVFKHHSNIAVTVLIVSKSNGNIIFAYTFSLNMTNHISAPIGEEVKKICKTLMRPVTTYGAEYWTLDRYSD
jgi:hypothetical protein